MVWRSPNSALQVGIVETVKLRHEFAPFLAYILNDLLHCALLKIKSALKNSLVVHFVIISVDAMLQGHFTQFGVSSRNKVAFQLFL